jgi:hypothetical protein
MRKIYAVPTLVASGDAVRETKAGPSSPENGVTGNGAAPGSVGFNL